MIRGSSTRNSTEIQATNLMMNFTQVENTNRQEFWQWLIQDQEQMVLSLHYTPYTDWLDNKHNF
jgi:hypothetical protein